jgi:hypothetical protein
VDLSSANLRKANLGGTNLRKANLGGADLSGADLSGANLSSTILIIANLTDADLTGCRVYGISAWDLKLEGAKQRDLVITAPGQPEITVDNIEVAQFIYLLLHNKKISNVIDTITSKVALILGRFTRLPRHQPLDQLVQPLALGFLRILAPKPVAKPTGRPRAARTAPPGRPPAAGAPHRCKVEGCPCRIDFSRAEATLIASSGSATSISLRRMPFCMPSPVEFNPYGVKCTQRPIVLEVVAGCR